MSDLKDAINEIPKLVKALKEKFASEKPVATEVKVGDRTFSYSAAEFGLGVEVMEGDKVCPDGEYETEFGKFTVKDGKVIDFQKKEEEKKEDKKDTPDFAAEMKAQKEAFEKQAADNKAYFEKEISAIKESFTTEIKGIRAESQTAAEKNTTAFKDIITLIEKIAESPVEKSNFKKKDGAPAPVGKSLMEQAAELSKQVFK